MALPSRFLENVTLTRYAPGDFVDGEFVQGDPTASTVRAVIQPLRGRELLAVPELERAREPIRIYTNDPLQTIDEAAKTQADVITWKGRRYQVNAVEPWQQTGTNLTHYKSLGLLIDAMQEGEPWPSIGLQ